MKQNVSRLKTTKKLTESAVMLALSVVLSYFKLVDLPYGGSITLFSMLPIVVIAYRFGKLWGLLLGFSYSVIQLMFGLNNLSYATSALAAVAIIVLDYVFAFTILGLGGIFKGKLKNQRQEIVLGTALVAFLRYVFHVISGCTVWAGLSIPTTDAFVYSIIYNATYMLPELIITVIGAAYLSCTLNLEGENLTRISYKKQTKSKAVLNLIGITSIVAALITDIILIAPKLQNAKTGEFDILGIFNINFLPIIIITLIAIIIFSVTKIISNHK